ncbi:MAG: aminotransferase class V-fold PLP-dependent enzyme [Thermomicrobiales bacterium]
MNLDQIRQDIPGLDAHVYFNTGGTGPSPRQVTNAVSGAYQLMADQGAEAPPVKQEIAARSAAARARIAELLGVDTDEIALLRSVSEGMNVVATGLDWQAGDEIILTDQEHPTGLLPWFNLRNRTDVELKFVPLTDDPDELLDRFKDAMSPRTKLLSLSHVTAENGLRLPAKEIVDLAHANGAQVLFDGAQSVGQFPIDLRDINADYYAMTGHKWLCGGMGVGAFYVRKDLLDDLSVTWIGAGSTADLNRETGEFTLHPGANRYEFGNRAWPLYIGLGEAVDYIQTLGTDQIESRAGETADGFKRDLASIPGVTVISPMDPALSTGIVSFTVDGMTGPEVASALWERWQIICRAAMHGTATRLSVAFFTNDTEIATARDAVATLAREGAA